LFAGQIGKARDGAVVRESRGNIARENPGLRRASHPFNDPVRVLRRHRPLEGLLRVPLDNDVGADIPRDRKRRYEKRYHQFNDGKPSLSS
jgi:hypothetical protein